MKWRNSKERELLAAGGSREQTLPNKNNPHPDLSDADSDRPKIDLGDLSPANSPQLASQPAHDAFSNAHAPFHDHLPEYDSSNESEEEINVT